MSMKILITGAGGFIGGFIVEEAQNDFSRTSFRPRNPLYRLQLR